ncbi:MerR family transcriptional regulator [Labrys neptuniae]
MADTPKKSRYTAGELAARTGVSERTVRYYLEEGLLPAPAGRGRGAHFGEGHLVRLRLIRAIQQAGNDLETIREYLNELGPEDAKAEAALHVWEYRQEQAQWGEVWREKFGMPATLYRYRIVEGVELLVESKAAPSREQMLAILRDLRKAFADED